jgi:amino acid adenylation domain-containing protein
MQINNVAHAISGMAQAHPDSIFLIGAETGASLTFPEFDQKCMLLSGMLHESGLVKGDKVALMMDNGLLSAQLFLGAMYGGFVTVPLNVRAGASQLSYMLDHCDARVVFVEHQYLSLLQEAIGSVSREMKIVPVNVDGPLPRFASVPSFYTPSPIHGDDLCLLMYSSGSTGRSKAAMHSHNTVLAHGRNSVEAHQLSSADRSLLVLPLYHINAECVTLIPTLLSGGSVVVAHRFQVSQFWGWVKDYGVTWSAIVPTIVSELVDWKESAKDRLPEASNRIRFFRSSSAPLAPALQSQFLAKFDFPLIQAMGSTEAGNVFSNPLPPRANKIGSPGVPWGFEARIVDREGMPVPPGESGEVLLRGAGLMTGYYKDDEGTAAVLDRDGWFHTGDLARIDEDGYFFVVGRSKELIIKGGVNIAPRQIDEVLESHPDILEAAAVGVPDRYFGEDVAAFAVLRPGCSVTELELLAFCEAKLGHFKTPSRIRFLRELPKGPSGKVLRLKLLDPAVLSAVATSSTSQDTHDGLEQTLPSSGISTEQVIAEAWEGVLGVSAIDLDTNFFALGGDSLSAIQCLSRLRDKLPMVLSLSDFFEHNTVREQARLVRQRLSRGNQPGLDRGENLEASLLLQFIPQGGDVIPQVDTSQPQPLSPAQQRLWFMEQLNPDVPVYNEAEAVRLTGYLDVGSLETAVNLIVERHELLRSTIRVIDDVPHAVVHKSWPLRIKMIDLSMWSDADAEAELDRLLVEEPRIHYDLEVAPGIRITLIRMGENDHVLILMMHHIICDWSSEGVIWRDLSFLYRALLKGDAARLPPLRVTHSQYSAMQHQKLSRPEISDDLKFWEEKLRGTPELLTLPADRRRPPIMSHAGARLRWKLSRQLTDALRQRSREERNSLFTIFAAALQTLIYRYTGEKDIPLGIPLADRDSQDFQSVLGFLLHTHVLRVMLRGDMPFRSLLGDVQKAVLDLYAHRAVPFHQIVEKLRPERNLSHMPLFQVMLNWRDRDQELAFIGMDGLAVESLMAHAGTSKFDLTLMATDMSDEICLEMEYSTDLFDKDRCIRMLRHYQSVLEAIAADPGLTLSAIPLLTPGEFNQTVHDWNNTAAEYPKNVPLSRLIEEQVERTPNAIAVTYEDGTSVTFADLNTRANQLAHELCKFGAGPDQLIGLFVDRSIDMVVALLAIQKAGAAYVPIDPNLPPARISYMIEDSALSILIMQRALRSTLPAFTGTVIEIDSNEWHANSGMNPEIPIAAENLAYVIYTSGSTGRPKGVEVCRGALTNLLWYVRDLLQLRSDETVLAVTTISFDIAAVDIWLPLLVGARIVIAGRESAMDGRKLLRLIEDHGVQFLQATPTTWRLLLSAGLRKTEITAVCTGEALPRDLAMQLRPEVARLWNLYGPTETTIWSTAWPVPLDDGAVLIGRPVANTQCYILDADGHPAPVGVPGELCIAGAGLAKGYRNQARLTAEKFLANPFVPGQRMYRTGDLARYRPDGNIECLGRNDSQVKIRGFRIELGEIEARIAELPGIRQAVVIAQDDGAEEKRLVAYYVATDRGPAITIEELRAHLLVALPEYMVPVWFVKMDSFPLTPSGKVDRKALPQPDGLNHLSPGYEAPRGALEVSLADLWAEVLNLETVGRHDNFFEMGGHSLRATQLMSRIRQALGVEIPLRPLFEGPTIARLATYIQALQFASRSSQSVVRTGWERGEL